MKTKNKFKNAMCIDHPEDKAAYSKMTWDNKKRVPICEYCANYYRDMDTGIYEVLEIRKETT